MNTLVAAGFARRSRTAAGLATAAQALSTPRVEVTLLLSGLVMALALLAHFVQVLDDHVQRAQHLRQPQAHSAAPADSGAQVGVPNLAHPRPVQAAGR